jgi:hypothetical protein
MPTVPVYDQPRVATERLPTPYAQPQGAPGVEALGAGLQSAGAQLEQVARQEQQKQDLARVQEARQALSDWKQANLYDAQKGYLAKRGQDALGQQDKYLADLDSTTEAISGSLANDEQRRAFAAMAQEQRQGVAEQMSAHELRESDRAAAGAYEGALSAAASDAANAFTDPVAVARARHDGMLAVLARGKAQGWSPEETDAQLRGFTTTMHLGVVDRMLAAGDGLGAQAYLHLHGGEIDGRARAGADRQAAAAGLDQRALGESRRIQSEAGDIGKQLQLAQAIPDAKLQDEVTQRLQHDFAAAKAAKQAQQNDVFDSAFTAYLKGGSLSAIPSTTKSWLIANAPEDWDRLRMKARQDAEYWRRLQAEGKGETPQQRAAMVNFAFDFGNNPEKYLGMRPQDFISEWGVQLSPRDLETAGNRVAGLKAETNKPDKNPALAPLVERMLNVRGSEAKLWPAGKPETWSAAEYDAYRLAHEDLVSREADWRRQHNGQTPPAEQYDKWMTEDFLRVRVKDSGRFFPDRPTLLQFQKGDAYKGKELEDRDAAAAALVRQGIQPTDELVDDLLRRMATRPVSGPTATGEQGGPQSPPSGAYPTRSQAR